MQTGSQYELIRFDVADGVAHIQLHRPERLNALCKAMLLEIGKAMDVAEAQSSIRAIVLSGAGRGFSSWLDLK